MRWNDTELEAGMGRLLQAGVLLAGVTMAAGGAIYLARHGGEIPDYRNFHGVAPEFKTVRGVWRGLFAGSGRALMQAGVLFMIATPVLRVGFAVAAFAAERDWLYSTISSVVLALLAYALLVR